jgi:hypothetical protein
LEQYAGMVPEGLDAYGPEDRRWAYKLIRLNVFADQDGGLSATWMFDRMGVIQENAHQRERTLRQHMPQIRFRTRLTEEALEIELV